jgi:multimeric flavodoxin WrbA
MCRSQNREAGDGRARGAERKLTEKEGRKIMQVLAIYGSPRKGGSTATMLGAFLEGIASAGGEARSVHVRDAAIAGCLGCGGCNETGVCVQEDDMARIYPLLEETPRIVVASPIYFYGVTGQLKLLIDRSQASFMRREMEGKAGRPASGGEGRKGFFLGVGATRGKRLFECAILTMKYFFRAIGVEYAGELCYREIESKGDLLKQPTILEECRRAGRDFLS